jgi:hypothetical protein
VSGDLFDSAWKRWKSAQLVKLVGFELNDRLAQVGTISMTNALTWGMIGGSRIVKLIAEISLGIVDLLKVRGMSNVWMET